MRDDATAISTGPGKWKEIFSAVGGGSRMKQLTYAATGK